MGRKQEKERGTVRKASRKLKTKASFVLNDDDAESTSLPYEEEFIGTLGADLDGYTDNDDDNHEWGNFENELEFETCDDADTRARTLSRNDDTSMAVEITARALHHELRNYFREGILFFVGGFAIRVKGGERATTDLDLEVTDSTHLQTLQSKIEGAGFNILKVSSTGFDAVDRATDIRINLRVSRFSEIKPISEECQGFEVVCDDIQIVQKLNALPNRRDITKQTTDLQDLEFLLSRDPRVRTEVAEFFGQEGLVRQLNKGKVIFLEEGRVKAFISSLSEKTLLEAVEDFKSH
ncbi:hypothetical protein TWF281_002729 [Arthrobotrys megalospora]